MSYNNLPSKFPGMYEKVVGEDGEERWVARITKNKAKHLCQVSFCTNTSEKYRKGPGRSLKCSNCRLRLWRANNPIKAIYNALRNKARRRKIPFTLTFAHFESICLETGYHEDRGRMAGDMHLDRIDAMKGYEDGNVQVMEAVANARKGQYEQTRTRDEWEPPEDEPEYRPVIKTNLDDNCPF